MLLVSDQGIQALKACDGKGLFKDPCFSICEFSVFGPLRQEERIFAFPL
jgi:hypothetical protein